MIVSETILKEKFSESDDKLYDYLIDNAETDKQVEDLMRLQELSKDYTSAIAQGDLEYEAYLEDQSKTLMDMGIDVNKLYE